MATMVKLARSKEYIMPTAPYAHCRQGIQDHGTRTFISNKSCNSGAWWHSAGCFEDLDTVRPTASLQAVTWAFHVTILVIFLLRLLDRKAMATEALRPVLHTNEIILAIASHLAHYST